MTKDEIREMVRDLNPVQAEKVAIFLNLKPEEIKIAIDLIDDTFGIRIENIEEK